MPFTVFPAAEEGCGIKVRSVKQRVAIACVSGWGCRRVGQGGTKFMNCQRDERDGRHVRREGNKQWMGSV